MDSGKEPLFTEANLHLEKKKDFRISTVDRSLKKKKTQTILELKVT